MSHIQDAGSPDILPRAIDIGKPSRIDTPGALLLCGLRGKGVELTGIRSERKSLLDLICGLELMPLARRLPMYVIEQSALGKRGELLK